MEQGPNKYDLFFKETSAISAEEQLAYEKLLAIKKKMAQSKVLTTKVGDFQAPSTLPVPKEEKSKTRPTKSSMLSAKDKFITKASSLSKQVPVEKTVASTKKTEKEGSKTKKKQEVVKPSVEQKPPKKPALDVNKRPSFSISTLPKKATEQTSLPIKEKTKTLPSTTPTETLKRTASADRKRPMFLTGKVPVTKDKKLTSETKTNTTTPPLSTKNPRTKPFNQGTLPNIFLTSPIHTTTNSPSTNISNKKQETVKNKAKKPVPPIPQKTSKKETQQSAETTKQSRAATKKRMQPINNQDSSSTYGRGEGAQVTDSPYAEKPILLEGKNLVPRSQEVHDILSYVPNWMVRWGNTVILLIIGGIFVMSYYIKYPDVVKGMISINSTSPPIPLVAKATGTLTLLKEDKEEVMEGELIGIVKSTADYQDILVVKEELSTFQEKLEKGWNFSYYELPTGLQLGDLQGAYSNLFIKLKEKKIQHQSTKNDQTRKQHINQQVTELEAIKKAKEKSLSIKYQEYSKAKNILDTRYKVLYKKGSISAEQMNAKESEVRNLLDIYQNDRMSFNEIKKRILDLNSNKIELDFQKADQRVLSASSLFTAYENLKNSIHTWEETYLLKAPMSGKLNFIQFTKNNMYLQQEQVIANVVPMLPEADSTSTMIGELLMPTIGAGKAAIGQTVNVELNDYPKKQYGIIEGEVVSIADVSTLIPDGQGMTAYKVVVAFPKGLENTMKKEIHFKHNMQGNAEIITADIRLIERFFHELRDLFGAK